MINRSLGSLMLVVGTSIGAGVLALPMVTASAGLMYASALLCFVWLLMTCGAFFLLKVNLSLPENTNLISMAGVMLGGWGKGVMWVLSLLLLYSLLSAYMGGGADVVYGISKQVFHWSISEVWATLIFVAILGGVIIRGIRSVDVVNRGLLSLKLLAFIVLIAFLLPHVTFNAPLVGSPRGLLTAIMPVVTSFGYAIVVPSLRVYCYSDEKVLYRILIIGSLIPLICYLIWVACIHWVFSFHDHEALVSLHNAPHAISSLSAYLAELSGREILRNLMNGFASISVATSFLGVGLALTDFMFDGLQSRGSWRGAVLTFSLVFLPPLFIVLWIPGLFIKALSFAGIVCVFLLIVMPALMLLRGVKKHKVTLQSPKRGLTIYSNPLIYLVLTGALLLLLGEGLAILGR